MDLMRAVQALTPDHREVIALRYFRDLKIADIAEVLGCPAGTVKSRINRALGALHASLDVTDTEVPR
jgi:RNA polymerase sigma-70 factor (ECF subfamily)